MHYIICYGRTSRVWDSLFVRKYGGAGGCGFAPRPGKRKESFSFYQETGKVFSPEIPFYSKFKKQMKYVVPVGIVLLLLR